ncbi:MAG: hypothetical protein ACR2IE_09355 [Candidatus Sumerlaeaceae bacterium]
MRVASNTAEGFVAILKALPEHERDAVVARLAKDKQLVEDILDIATIQQRRSESSVQFREYLRKKQKG